MGSGAQVDFWPVSQPRWEPNRGRAQPGARGAIVSFRPAQLTSLLEETHGRALPSSGHWWPGLSLALEPQRSPLPPPPSGSACLLHRNRPISQGLELRLVPGARAQES